MPVASRIVVLLLASSPLAAAPVDFATEIQPLFAKHCTACHGETKQKAGLRLTTGAQSLRGSLNGKVIVPGKSAESRLIQALHGEGDLERMPPTESLDADEIKLIARWIDEGAKVPANETVAKHWAFETPKPITIPANANPIDHLLETARKAKNLQAAPAADKTTLLRRLTLDLTGLPPTVAELDEFLKDDSSDAFEKRIDALLASPAYGERWGRHFLDVWRYSDWYGYKEELRNSQKHIWNWRDWTVESFNANKPYDAMIREMLAGDEIAPLDPMTLRATGYLARNYYKFNRNVWLDDIVEHTGKAFLGITLNCCRCHDHMYDPFTQEEYYRFKAVFEPHQVRLDPVSGNDAEKNGVPRVFDADLKAPTFLFTRGNEKDPVTDKPLAPGVPACLSATNIAPKAIQWSREIAHPSLQEDRQHELLHQVWLDYDTRRQQRDPNLTASLLANLYAVQMKLKADKARFSTPPAADAPERIRLAVSAHLEAATAAAEYDWIQSQSLLTLLETDTVKNKKEIATHKKLMTTLKARLTAAKVAQEKPPPDYPPLVPGNPEFSTGRRLALANWITSKDNPLTARVFVNHVWLRHFGQPLVPTVFEFGKNGRPPVNQPLLDWLAVEFMKSDWDVKKLHRLMLTSRAYRMKSSHSNETTCKLDPDNALLWRMNPRPLEAEAIRDSLLLVAGMLDPAMGGPELDDVPTATTQRRSLYYRHAPEKMMPFLMTFDSANTAECYRRDVSVVPQQAMALVNSTLSRKAAEAVAKQLPADDLVNAVYRKLLSRMPTDAEAKLCEEYLAKNPPAMLVQALFNHAEFTTIR